MGYYVNPIGMTKEEWLASNAVQTPVEDCAITPTHLPVCMVNNGPFNAAGIAFSEDEFAVFSRPDERHKVWFMAERKDLATVSDLPEKYQ